MKIKKNISIRENAFNQNKHKNWIYMQEKKQLKVGWT